MLPEIIYEDKQVLVVYKPEGMAVETAKITEQDLYSWVKSYLAKKGEGNGDAFMIHRLDQPVEGLLVFAKTQAAAKILNQQMVRKEFAKDYLAVIYIIEALPTGHSSKLEDFLWKDGKSNTSKVVNSGVKGAKKAVLSYNPIEFIEDDDSSGRAMLVEIQLETGRHHQIRVQMSHHRMPLLGDVKYGTEASKAFSQKYNVRQTALCAYKLSFIHPTTGDKLKFCIKPKKPIFSLFNK